MAQITAAMVKQLREMTDSPMMECKKALVEADGDMDAAVDVLRKNGLAKAAKKAGRETNEGAVAAFVSEDGKTGALLELSCETDFVGSNAKFTGFASKVAEVVATTEPADVDALLEKPMGEETVSSELTEMIHIMGENMKIDLHKTPKAIRPTTNRHLLRVPVPICVPIRATSPSSMISSPWSSPRPTAISPAWSLLFWRLRPLLP